MRFDGVEERADLRDAIRRSFSDAGAASGRAEAWRILKEDLALFTFLGDGPQSPAERNSDLAVVFEEAGRALLSVSLLDTLAQAPALLEGAPSDSAMQTLTMLLTGDARMGFAWREGRFHDDPAIVRSSSVSDQRRLSGVKLSVPGGTFLTHVIVTAKDALVTADEDDLVLLLLPIDADGITITQFRSIDDNDFIDLQFDEVEIGEAAILHRGRAARERGRRAQAHGAAAVAAEALGVMQALIDLTTVHCLERIQFRQPIADFQSVQHRLADMLIQLELAKGAVLLVTDALEDEDRREGASLAARCVVGAACRYIGENAIQLHGGMGMADETATSGYFKRALALSAQFGTSASVLHGLSRSPPLESILCRA